MRSPVCIWEQGDVGSEPGMSLLRRAHPPRSREMPILRTMVRAGPVGSPRVLGLPRGDGIECAGFAGMAGCIYLEKRWWVKLAVTS